jgi:hypothetical protein
LLVDCATRRRYVHGRGAATKKKSAVSPYNVLVPDTQSVSFIEKDTKRFPDTNGWGYAQFTYDAASDSFKPVGTGAGFGKTECHQCHTRA